MSRASIQEHSLEEQKERNMMLAGVLGVGGNVWQKTHHDIVK